jgi:deoxyribose-phosphate aldolase
MFIMSQILLLHYKKSGKRVGIKPAGGISEPSAALDYFAIVKHVLGRDWLTSGLFRIGASRLADKLTTL